MASAQSGGDEGREAPVCLDRARLFDRLPHAHGVSNGRYTALITNAGSGYSECDGIALTRWRADPVEDGDGYFHYLRDLASGRFWSVGYQPTGGDPEHYEVRFAQGRAEILRVEDGIRAALTVTVAPDDACELRRCVLQNASARPRRIEITSYLEAVLQASAADAAHPAFSKLFVQTEAVPERRALLASRRPRGADEQRRWLVHWLVEKDAAAELPLAYETDRQRFIGRGRSLAAPAALTIAEPLSLATGNVLDPILCLRTALDLAPGASHALTFGLGLADSRDGALALAERHGTPAAVARIFGPAPQASRQEPTSAAPHLDAGGHSPSVPHAARYRPAATGAPPEYEAAGEPLICDNGLGGFTGDGRAYVIRLAPERRPPLPWTHVAANPAFGFIVSESGAGATWSGNSRENRLTPWYNDPVSDPHGEALYLRDEDAGTFWSPTPGPVAIAPCTVRYGLGDCRFLQTSAELEQEICQFVPREHPLKVTGIQLRNLAARPRRLSVFFYARLVLGGLPGATASSVVTSADRASGALLARNPERGEFSAALTFARAVAPAGCRVHHSGDRTAFIGRNGSPARPAALLGAAVLDGRTGAGLDPCFALQIELELAPGESRQLAFLLGEGADERATQALIRAYASLAAIDQAYEGVTRFWQDLVSSIQVRTPAPAIDLMANGWLVYQTLCCRLWARSAFYQSGGAFGFRDQLQDAAALIHLRPELTRAQILLHAGHQFVEGDVLHWWHPPQGRGVRTRFSDDLLWLPLVTADYVRSTGDRAVLDEEVGFLRARKLAEDEDEAFLLPEDSGERASLYEHCGRALDRSLTKGAHGLPLMGTGDWNDGMNRVGRLGRGESVWLGFFLYAILGRFIPLCQARGDAARVERYEAYRAHLAVTLNGAGWDGAWYRRAYYDDGTPLGSAESEECQIDALAQAWAVISGVAPPERAARCLDALEAELVSEDDRLIRLLTPPFDRTPHDPGYIKGYVPGVRENGGQYTHAALWAVQALAEAGRTARAASLLEMLSPVSHARTAPEVARYRVEPYVIAADVYGAPPHVGRGGWTWYTGSAGWMFRVILETVLGCRREGSETLLIEPRLPPTWPECEVRWRLPGGDASYIILMVNPTRGGGRVVAATLDERPVELRDGAARVPILRDGGDHRVRLELG
jgi:N,N'-diacetylchitobiose phosphorylase